jgi:hypothetical protein
MSGACLERRDWYNNEQVLTIEVKQHQIQGNLIQGNLEPKEAFEQKVPAITDDNPTAVGDSTLAGGRRGWPIRFISSHR